MSHSRRYHSDEYRENKWRQKKSKQTLNPNINVADERKLYDCVYYNICMKNKFMMIRNG